MQKKTKSIIRKRFGQNFLHDRNIIQKIIRSINPKINDHFLEIGPGQGALTYPLLEHLKKIDVIEIDKDLSSQLDKSIHSKDINIYCMDALSFDFKSVVKGNKKIRLIGNLPYNISTPLIFHMLNSNSLFEDLHIMVQKEVADRMTSDDNKKTYGRLSIAIQARCNVKKLFNISPNAFFPKPKVISSLIKITPKNNLDEGTLDSLDDILKTVFSKRRKKISNGLKDYFSKEEIKGMGIDCESRPENLTVKDYIKLSKKRCF